MKLKNFESWTRSNRSIQDSNAQKHSNENCFWYTFSDEMECTNCIINGSSMSH